MKNRTQKILAIIVFCSINQIQALSRYIFWKYSPEGSILVRRSYTVYNKKGRIIGYQSKANGKTVYCSDLEDALNGQNFATQKFILTTLLEEFLTETEDTVL